jgi:hypothetical protein
VKRKANERSRLIFVPLSDKAYSLYFGRNVPSTLSSFGMVAYANRKVQETRAGLKLKGTHQLTAYADGVNLLGDNREKHKNFN